MYRDMRDRVTDISMNMWFNRYLTRYLNISQKYLYQSEIFWDISKDISPYLKSLEILESWDITRYLRFLRYFVISPQEISQVNNLSEAEQEVITIKSAKFRKCAKFRRLYLSSQELCFCSALADIIYFQQSGLGEIHRQWPVFFL